jgi:predicted nucleic acid-binding protein
MTVALDTMTLIWGLQRGGNPSQSDLHEMQFRATVLIEALQQAKDKIIIPCVAVAELLVGVDPADHANFIAVIQKNFFCPPFDIRASELAAKLHLEHKKLPVEDRQSRKTLKSDAMIVATAKAAGASAFYSHDPKCRKMASLLGIVPKELPTRHPDMFRNNELRKQFGLPPETA